MDHAIFCGEDKYSAAKLIFFSVRGRGEKTAIIP
jgi:hypothetical protein